MVVDEVVLVRLPRRWFAEQVAPTRGFRDESEPSFIDTPFQPLDVFGGGQRPVVEVVFVNPVGEQDGVVDGIHAGAHSGHDTIGPSVVGRVPGAAQEAVGILDHELERNPTGLRAEGPELALRIAAYP